MLLIIIRNKSNTLISWLESRVYDPLTSEPLSTIVKLFTTFLEPFPLFLSERKSWTTFSVLTKTFTSEIVNRKMSIIKLSEWKNCFVFIFGGTSHKLQFRFGKAKELFLPCIRAKCDGFMALIKAKIDESSRGNFNAKTLQNLCSLWRRPIGFKAREGNFSLPLKS